MSDLYGFAYTLDETLKTMEDVISTGNHDGMFLDTYYWLKTLKEYQEIGTVEECREAVEKQKPKETIRISGRYPYKCPTCNGKLEIGYRHCIICGQLLRYLHENLEGMEDDA